MQVLKFVIALLIFSGGSLMFEKVENRFPDKNWLTVITKILVAFVLVIAYGFLLKWLNQAIG